jgi:pilus assembly protein CpaF
MFTVIITDKGGAERRETFDKNEITLGRVQGNDLMLATGNVSKHHARLLLRDGRFVAEAQTREAATKNSWRTALYFAMAESEWFCAEGFLLLSET